MIMRLSIVVPCYNEEPVLQETTVRLSAVLDSLVEKRKISSDSFILYVNDGSRDKTWTLIASLHERESLCERIEFSRKCRTSKCVNGRLNDGKRICGCSGFN